MPWSQHRDVSVRVEERRVRNLSCPRGKRRAGFCNQETGSLELELASFPGGGMRRALLIIKSGRDVNRGRNTSDADISGRASRALATSARGFVFNLQKCTALPPPLLPAKCFCTRTIVIPLELGDRSAVIYLVTLCQLTDIDSFLSLVRSVSAPGTALANAS